MYSVNARDHFNCSPPLFLMGSTTKQMRPNGGEGYQLIALFVVAYASMSRLVRSWVLESNLHTTAIRLYPRVQSRSLGSHIDDISGLKWSCELIYSGLR